VNTPVRRVGSVTAGLSLIAAGVLYFAATFVHGREFLEFIFRLWPLILVSLGVEILLSGKADRKYDFFSMILMMLCVGAATGLEIARIFLLYP